MPDLLEGHPVEVQGSGASRYVLEKKGEVLSCTCPAWRNQGARIELRTCKHLRAYVGDSSETARVGASGPTPAHSRGSTLSAGGRAAAKRAPRPMEDTEVQAWREARLAAALERFPAVAERVQKVYGLRLPRHVAYAMGFWMSLREAERKEAWAYIGNGPAGIGAWFNDDAGDYRLIEGLDERLEMRFRRDPPEMVTIFSGNSDGGHWGLFYDDPKQLPALVVENFARDSAETWSVGPTLLGALAESLARQEAEDPSDASAWTHRAAVVAWLDGVAERERAAYEAERPAWLGARAGTLLGGLEPLVPGWAVPEDLQGHSNLERRSAAYQADDPVVHEWIALAKRELAAGAPGRALFLGRELHWVDSDVWRQQCTELLVGAYEALGRGALAEIVRVHHAHRDLRSVGVYEWIETPFSALLSQTPTAGWSAAFAQLAEPPSEAEVAAALRTSDLAALDALLELPGAEVSADAAAAVHLEEARSNERYAAEYPNLGELAAEHRAAAMRIFERRGVRGETFVLALGASSPEIRAAALEHADLAWRSPHGRTVLHLAARAVDVDAVERLLARGVDPKARDADGKTPYDAARAGWETRPNETHAVFDRLVAAGGGPEAPKPPPAAEWAAGTAVAHPKFGAGVVLAVTGAGNEAKLTIRFPDGAKVLLARFVTRG